MTQFVSWLFAQASLVYQWFGSNFRYYLHIVNNTWDWIIEQSQKAYNAAIDWSWDQILRFGQDISNLFDWVEYQIKQIKAGLLEDVTGLMDWLVYQLENIQVIDLQWVYDLINETITYVQSIPDQINAWVMDRLSELQSWVNDNYGWIFDAYQYILDLVSAIPTDLFVRLRDFFENDYVNVVFLVRNPLVAIFEIIWPYFVSFFCFVIAHAMGSVEKEIPYDPPWRG